MLTDINIWSRRKQTQTIIKAMPSGNRDFAKPYPRQTKTRSTASEMNMIRSPNESMALPKKGWKRIPITPPMVMSFASIWVGWWKMVTRTQGAKVRKICFLEP